jgi:cytochrome c-type biogenesis protein
VVPDLGHQLLLALGLGLLGFIEPCSVGGHLLFLKVVEGREQAFKLRQTAVFALTRTVFMGALGALAALVGQAFLALQRGGWLLLGSLYAALGVLYLTGKVSLLMQRIGPSLARFSDARGSAGLGVLFGLNVPACAAPLLLVILGTVALAPDRLAEPIVTGFVTLAVFGLALSAPLALLIVWPRAASQIDRVFGMAAKTRMVAGSVLVLLGLWSIYFGLRA